MKRIVLSTLLIFALISCLQIDHDFSELNEKFSLKPDPNENIGFLKAFIKIYDGGKESEGRYYFDLGSNRYSRKANMTFKNLFLRPSYMVDFKIHISDFNEFFQKVQHHDMNQKETDIRLFLEYKMKINSVSIKAFGFSKHWTSTTKVRYPINIKGRKIEDALEIVPLAEKHYPKTILYDSVQVVIIGR